MNAVAASPDEEDTAAILCEVEARLGVVPRSRLDWDAVAAALAEQLTGWAVAPRAGGHPGLTLDGPGSHGHLNLIAESRTPESRAFLAGEQAILYYTGDARAPVPDEIPMLKKILEMLDELLDTR